MPFNYKKFVLRPVLYTSALLLLLYLFAFIYISYNKQSIIHRISETMSKKIKGDVVIKNAELSFFSHFPKIAVELKDIVIKDSMYAKHGHAFLQAKKIFAYLSITKLITKKDALKGIRVENAQIYLYTDTSGYTNTYLMHPKKDSGAAENSSTLQIRNLILKNFRFTQEDKRREKLVDISVASLHADINNSAAGNKFDIELEAHVHQLGFNLARGSYLMNKDLKGDFVLNYNNTEQRLYFSDMQMDIDKHPFTIGGEFNFGAKTFLLDIVTKQITMQQGLSVLTQRLAKNISKFKYSKAIDITARIAGPLAGGEPYADIKWAAKNVTVTTPLAVFTNSSFTGSFNNELVKGAARNDENSRINVRNFTGNWEGFGIASDNINIDNLTVPAIDCDLRSDFPLTTLNNVLQSAAVDLQQGNAALRIHYKGSLLTGSNVSPDVRGTLSLKNGSVIYHPRNVGMKDLQAVIQFAGTDVSVRDMRFSVLKNTFNMSGSAGNLLTLMKTQPDKIIFDWNISTPALDLESFTGLLKNRTKKLKAKKANGVQSISNALDEMLDKGTVRLNIHAAQVQYKKFNASDVKAAIDLAEDNWILKNVSLEHAGGRMVLNGTVRAVNPAVQAVTMRTDIFNADIKKLMSAFNDFGQTGIESRNLSGKLTATADVSMLLDRERLQTSNMNGVVDFSLKNGALIDYEPMQKLQSVFKNRDMRHVYFAELKDRLEIKDKEITINRMEIQSSAVSLFVEGVYSLKGNTDISIQVPLNNIKRRDSTYVPQNIGVASKAGMSMYLRGKPGNDGKIKFSPDVFKKFRKN